MKAWTISDVANNCVIRTMNQLFFSSEETSPFRSKAVTIGVGCRETPL
jgi:hypothetical protein